MFALFHGETKLFHGYAQAYHTDHRWIDTREAELVRREITESGLILTYQANNGLVLTETLSADGEAAFASCTSRTSFWVSTTFSQSR